MSDIAITPAGTAPLPTSSAEEGAGQQSVEASTSSVPQSASLQGTGGNGERKEKVKRGSHACLRCKNRKQRCIPVVGAACENCQSVRAECIPSPRVEKRKRVSMYVLAVLSRRKKSLMTCSLDSASPSYDPKRHASSAESHFPSYMHPPPFGAYPYDPSGAPHYPGYPPYPPPMAWGPPPSAEAYPQSAQRQSPLSTPQPPPSRPLPDVTSAPDSREAETFSQSGTEQTNEVDASETMSQSSGSDGEEDRNDHRLSNDAARGVAFLSINALGSPV